MLFRFSQQARRTRGRLPAPKIARTAAHAHRGPEKETASFMPPLRLAEKPTVLSVGAAVYCQYLGQVSRNVDLGLPICLQPVADGGRLRLPPFQIKKPQVMFARLW